MASTVLEVNDFRLQVSCPALASTLSVECCLSVFSSGKSAMVAAWCENVVVAADASRLRVDSPAGEVL